ncbi:MAG: hypothetical protein NZM40_00380 [Sphingomonadaceae bacterium]|uniref:hypothetical protein n=1 Tax=Thermaurantiacus sp. TaxID=2820283 RepID=UPI00298EEEE7|nr:hypothetical protein [Thermaurantiacus sp.]MCS6985898.1 hypothetical protein [Sphingomonadaceae bacterium]MDW8414886.1 hypothetical protein [Thermaurantiacus sp.]
MPLQHAACRFEALLVEALLRAARRAALADTPLTRGSAWAEVATCALAERLAAASPLGVAALIARSLAGSGERP